LTSTTPVPGNLLTTAMVVMSRTDVDRALEVAFSPDILFWPQLPRFNSESLREKYRLL
jgi:hypothetical protein